jgi:nitroreductase
MRGDILKIIKQRRSIRKYRQKPLDDKLIMRIIEAGRWAPSGLNNQPWKFMLIKDKTKKEALSRFTEYSRIIKGAACIICVFLDKRSVYSRDKDLMALGAAVENMLLEAYSLGLGACWLGEIINRKKQVHRYLQSSCDWELMAVVSLGYPAEKKSAATRKKLSQILVNEQEL